MSSPLSNGPRGARSRRDAGKSGWQLLTALLVLAIVASATLVFTNRVELLRLAVVLSLWAAVLAAFVTVIYRRQSESDQARARDMRYVYDLQLDREIAARREYELAVEANLRRQLSREARSQASEEMAALRAELASLRSHLQVLLGTDLGDTPALDFDRSAEPVTMVMPATPGRVESSRVTFVEEVSVAEVIVEEAAVESPIIDVPEEPLSPPRPPVAPVSAAEYGGSHLRSPVPPPPLTPWRPPEAEPRRGRHWTPDTAGGPAAVSRGRHWVDPAGPEKAGPEKAGPEKTGPEKTGLEKTGSQKAGRDKGATPKTGRDKAGLEAAAAAGADESGGQHTAGQSVADLMARLQQERPSDGGGRRRRGD